MKVRNNAKTTVTRLKGLKLVVILEWRTVSNVVFFYSLSLLQQWGFQWLSMEINAATLRSEQQIKMVIANTYTTMVQPRLS